MGSVVPNLMLVGLGEGRSFGSVYWSLGEEAVEEMDMSEETSSRICMKENIVDLGVECKG